jgi:hypothetical protein
MRGPRERPNLGPARRRLSHERHPEPFHSDVANAVPRALGSQRTSSARQLEYKFLFRRQCEIARGIID